MNNTNNTPTVRVSDLGSVVHFTAIGSDIDACRAVAVRAAHEHVFANGRTASVETALVGRHGGAYIDGVQATVRYA